MAKKVSTTNKNVEKENATKTVDTNPVLTVEEIKENIESADVSLPTNENTMDAVQEKVAEMMAPVIEINEKIENISKTSDELNEIINESPEVAQEIIKAELEKVEEVKKEITKTINKLNSNSEVTSWWNGMGYDF